jgi:hypothetical protein
MSRPSRSSRAGNRGRHRHIDSPETRRFEEMAPGTEWLRADWQPPEPEPLPPVEKSPAPARPSWLAEETYNALVALREELA